MQGTPRLRAAHGARSKITYTVRRTRVLYLDMYMYTYSTVQYRDGGRAVSRRSLICVRSLLDVCFTTV